MNNQVKTYLFIFIAILVVAGVYGLGRLSKDATTDELLTSYNLSKNNLALLCRAVGKESTNKIVLSKKLHEKIPEFTETHKIVICSEHNSAPSEKTESGTTAE